MIDNRKFSQGMKRNHKPRLLKVRSEGQEASHLSWGAHKTGKEGKLPLLSLSSSPRKMRASTRKRAGKERKRMKEGKEIKPN